MTGHSGKMSLSVKTEDKSQDTEDPMVLKLREQNSQQGDKLV